MLNAIKQAAIEAVAASNPVTILFGEIMQTNPLEVNVDQRFTLTADFLILTEATRELRIGETIIRRGLRVGDIVILVRAQGGQQYLVLDRVVET